MAASRWSTSTKLVEHKDLQSSCLAVASDGRIALSSRRAIAIVSSDNPDLIQCKIKRNTKIESSAAEFSPIDSNMFGITNAQSVHIYAIDKTGTNDGAIPTNGSYKDYGPFATLRGHTRNITDLNWSRYDTNLMATASYDNYMNIWDIREFRRPIASMSSFAGATQVKWSSTDEHILATSHEGDVRIWDKRKGNTPLNYITAHLSKINGLDWNPNIGSQFATCSQDGTVKFWDMNCPKSKPESIATCLPVWRARFTPFGNGMLTAIVPQLRRAGENNSLWLWNLDCFEQPIHSFVGHLDVVLDFGWYSRNNSDYDLITWSKDNSLRIWKVDPQLLTPHNDLINPYDYNTVDINYNQSSSSVPTDEETDSSLPMRPTSLDLAVSKSHKHQSKALHPQEIEIRKPQTPETPVNSVALSLVQEFSLINLNIPNVKIDELNASRRVCIITATTSITCRLKMTFPAGYPNHVSPHFSFLNGSASIPSDDTRKELLRVLQSTALAQVKRNRTCLEPCLRQFIATLERLTGTSPSALSKPTLFDLLPPHQYGSYLDGSVPFPRTSGARFCSSNILVCFGRPPHLEQMSVTTEFTPRSLSALSAYLSTHCRTSPVNQQPNRDAMPSISSFYFNNSRAFRRQRSKLRRRKSDIEKTTSPPKHESVLCGPVFVFSISSLLPISRTLAENYVLYPDDVVKMCEVNATVASVYGRRDLLQIWNLVKLSADVYKKSLNSNGNNNTMESPWVLHPFGKKMIKSLIEHSIEKCNDIQTAVMILCAFHTQDQDSKEKFQYRLGKPSPSGNNSPGNSPYHTVGASGLSTTPEFYNDWNIISAMETLKRTRSNSWSDYIDNDVLSTSLSHVRLDSYCEKLELEEQENNLKMLDTKLQHQYDCYKQIYADILYNWQLLEKRALVLKCLSQANVNQSLLFHVGIDFVTECKTTNCEKKDKECRSAYCLSCKQYALECVICRLPVRGATNNCFICGHGGHTLHMYEWFEQFDHCPTGCGCACLRQQSIFG